MIKSFQEEYDDLQGHHRFAELCEINKQPGFSPAVFAGRFKISDE